MGVTRWWRRGDVIKRRGDTVKRRGDMAKQCGSFFVPSASSARRCRHGARAA